MAHTRQDHITGIHKVPLYGALAVVLLALVLVAGSTLSRSTTKERLIADAVSERLIRFESGQRGMFSVLDAQNDSVIASYGSGEGAFVRTSIRTMSLRREAHAVSPTLPYRLVKTAKGSLALVDPETQSVLNLSAFGQVATQSYLAILSPAETNARPPKTAQAAPKGNAS